MKTIVITGANSGIGLATAKLFAQQGWNVAATLRDINKGTGLAQVQGIKLYQLDVTNNQSIITARDNILRELGNVDVVLNNAGYGLMGVFEATTREQIQRQFNTNLFGLMDVTQVFLPHFREKKAGMFVNVSSLGGQITYPFTSLYHSSKWAVEGFSESLWYELGELGIQVKLVEPGAVATDFSGRSMEMAMPTDFPDYQYAANKFITFLQQSDRVPSTPEEIARGIFAAVSDNSNRLRYPLGDAADVLAKRKTVGEESFLNFNKSAVFGK